MFKGTLPKDCIKIISGIIGDQKISEVYVGCSGNFTIERSLAPLGIKLHSNDVSIYSCVLGWYFSRSEFSVSLSDSRYDEFEWLVPYLQRPIDIAATILLSSVMLEGYHCKDRYFQRIRDAYKKNWERLHGDTVAKLRDGNFTVNSFHAGDVVDWIQMLPESIMFISFPPFWSGGYEKLNRHLDDVFEWNRPEYPILDDKRKSDYIEMIIKKDNWIFGTNYLIPELVECLRGECRTVSKGNAIYVYSRKGRVRRIGPRMGCSTVSINRLQMDQEIGQQMTIIRISNDDFNSIRSQYLGNNIVPCNAPIAFGVLVDTLLVGCFALNTVYRGLKEPSEYAPHVYIFSDFAIAPTRYSRLSKLILYAALSKEAKHISERLSKKRINGVLTTAFSKNPISMKYRGLLEVHSRVKNETTGEYRINYNGSIGRWTLKEGLEIWKKKYLDCR